MRSKRKLRENVEDINITPIMDVVFLILIYFFVIVSNDINNQAYKVRLPLIDKSVEELFTTVSFPFKTIVMKNLFHCKFSKLYK